nr:MAG TPA: hypothetical protein [Bacteriophage sp.]
MIFTYKNRFDQGNSKIFNFALNLYNILIKWVLY